MYNESVYIIEAVENSTCSSPTCTIYTTTHHILSVQYNAILYYTDNCTLLQFIWNGIERLLSSTIQFQTSDSSNGEHR